MPAAARCPLFAVALLLQAGQLAAQTGSPQSGLLQFGSMEGQVTNSLTGDPVPNAIIHLLPLRYTRAGTKPPPQTNSQPDGAFHFDVLTPGEYLVTAERAGFVPNEVNSRSRIVTVTAAQLLSGVAVSLTPQGFISGRVEEEDGTPIPAARVEALAPFTTHGRTSLKLYSDGNTDAHGNFLLSKLPPNAYYLLAEPPTSEKPPAKDPTKDPTSAKKIGDLVRTIYPRALDIESASTIPLSAGQSVPDIAIRVRRTYTFHIRGKVADASADSFISKLTVAVSPRGSVDSPSLTKKILVNPNKTFDVGGLTPGAYTLRLMGMLTNSGRGQALLARDDFEISGANLDGVVLSILPALTITGQVRVNSSTNSPVPIVTITARPLEDLSHGAMGSAKSTTDGSFTFNKLDPGLYVFQVHSPGSGWYVKSLVLNQQDVLNKTADLANLSSARLDVLMSPGAGEVDVTITGAAPENAILLVPETVGPDGTGVLFGYAGQDRSYSFKSVSPGKYVAYVTQRGDPNLWQNPDFLRAIQDQGTSLEVAENSRQQIQLPLLPLEEIEQAAARIGLQIQ